MVIQNEEYYANFLRHLWKVIKTKFSRKLTKGLLFHQNSIPAQKLLVSMAAMRNYGFVVFLRCWNYWKKRKLRFSDVLFLCEKIRLLQQVVIKLFFWNLLIFVDTGAEIAEWCSPWITFLATCYKTTVPNPYSLLQVLLFIFSY